jgi:hypothetical protein
VIQNFLLAFSLGSTKLGDIMYTLTFCIRA